MLVLHTDGYSDILTWRYSYLDNLILKYKKVYFQPYFLTYNFSSNHIEDMDMMMDTTVATITGNLFLHLLIKWNIWVGSKLFVFLKYIVS